MRLVLQRVSSASVKVDGIVVGEIKEGVLALVSFVPQDKVEDYEWCVKKMTQLRVFNDEGGIMNKSVTDVNGDLLIVSQFTLHALVKKGNRPSYMIASKPEIAKKQYENFLEVLKKTWQKEIHTGVFGADMKVNLLNDGPVTIILDSKNKE